MCPFGEREMRECKSLLRTDAGRCCAPYSVCIPLHCLVFVCCGIDLAVTSLRLLNLAGAAWRLPMRSEQESAAAVHTHIRACRKSLEILYDATGNYDRVAGRGPGYGRCCWFCQVC